MAIINKNNAERESIKIKREEFSKGLNEKSLYSNGVFFMIMLTERYDRRNELIEDKETLKMPDMDLFFIREVNIIPPKSVKKVIFKQ